MAVLKCTLQSLKKTGLFGVGTGDRFDPLDKCFEMLGVSQLKGYNPHNQYLDYLLVSAYRDSYYSYCVLRYLFI
jgi:hypothetical protein